MTTAMPRRAMVLAAGLGLRLRPITERLPKPLVEVGGQTMLDRTLDGLAMAGVEDAVVNVHYLPELIEAHLAKRTRPRVTVSRETTLLDTGGGVTRALAQLGAVPFFVANSDVVVLHGPTLAWRRLAAMWRDADMDALLLLHPTATAFGYDGNGDFAIASDGRLRRRREHEILPFLFTGLQMLHPRLFDGAPAGAFSLNRLYDLAASRNRLFGVVHDGAWLHIGAPPALAKAETYLKELI